MVSCGKLSWDVHIFLETHGKRRVPQGVENLCGFSQSGRSGRGGYSSHTTAGTRHRWGVFPEMLRRYHRGNNNQKPPDQVGYARVKWVAPSSLPWALYLHRCGSVRKGATPVSVAAASPFAARMAMRKRRGKPPFVQRTFQALSEGVGLGRAWGMVPDTRGAS